VAKTYTARWLFPIDAPPLERGTITIAHDKIVAVEPHGTRTPDVDLGNVAILPGFVNAHTHLDLTGARGLCPPKSDFTRWLRMVVAFRRTCTPEQAQADIAQGISECLRFGATLIGDIQSRDAWAAFFNLECRAVTFFELIGLSDERAKSAAAQYSWLLRSPHAPTWNILYGLSPHAPYSVGIRMYELAMRQPHLVATHLAESREELELFHSLTGPFVDFLQELKVWEPDNLVASPSDVLRMFPRGLFVHCNYLDPATPFLSTQTVVVCPRTHAAFGHPHHPFPKMNVRVALGTDSLASNPDLDILAEARFLRRHYPEVTPGAIMRMLTLNGAQALGFHAVTGSLRPDKSADLVVVPLPNEDRNDPHDLVLDSELPISRVMFRGEWRV